MATLKTPYTGEPSRIGIQLTNVGSTSGSTYNSLDFTGFPYGASNFVLFDGLGQGISATNCNLVLRNMVFQNTQHYLAANITNTTTTYAMFGGEAVSSLVNNVLNYKLDIAAPSASITTRFWDCHRAVFAKDVYEVDIEKCSFRSGQTTTSVPNATLLTQGNYGVVLNTNRFKYLLHNNEFTNVHTGIFVPIAAGGYYPVSTCSTCVMINGVSATSLSVQQNTFAMGTSSMAYMNKAVQISCVNSITPAIVSNYTVTPPVVSEVIINNNKINNAYHGIYVSGYTGLKTTIRSNSISLLDDATFTISTINPQMGISLANCNSASNFGGQYSITDNTLSAQNTTNTMLNLVDCNNNIGLQSPSVTCNYLSNAGNGFVFNSANNNAVWAGNNMNPMGRGLVLDNSGVMGQQGTNGTSANNIWTGAWSGTFNGTYIGANSTAILSPMFVKAGNTYPPLNSGTGTISPSQWFGAANTISISTGGDYNCGGNPNSFVVPLPNSGDYSDANDYYIVQTAVFRFLHFNDSVRNSDPAYTNYYNALQSTNMGIIIQVEQALYDGDVSTANTFNNSLVTPNTIESNYQAFFTVYIHYLTAGTYNVDDSLALVNLAYLCPGDDGAVVFQARALYNYIYNADVIYPQCGAAGSRMMDNTNTKELVNHKNWNVQFFPNPASNELTLVSIKESEKITVTIRDINNRVVKEVNLKITNFIANLELELMNGVYIITVKNSNNEAIIKKLLISR